jgi:hypothetical protein
MASVRPGKPKVKLVLVLVLVPVLDLLDLLDPPFSL